MAALIDLIVLVPIIILILLFSIFNKTSAQQDLLRSISEKLKDLNEQFHDLAKELNKKTVNGGSGQLLALQSYY